MCVSDYLNPKWPNLRSGWIFSHLLRIRNHGLCFKIYYFWSAKLLLEVDNNRLIKYYYWEIRSFNRWKWCWAHFRLLLQELQPQEKSNDRLLGFHRRMLNGNLFPIAEKLHIDPGRWSQKTRFTAYHGAICPAITSNSRIKDDRVISAIQWTLSDEVMSYQILAWLRIVNKPLQINFIG